MKIKSILTFIESVIKALWNSCLQYIESGDLILPVVLVSAAHYGVALQDHDNGFIAFVIGVLVDLGHYRILKAAIKYSRESVNWRWVFAACVMTFLAFGFHFAFYNQNGDWKEWLFSVSIPLVIAFLAALSVKENWALKAARSGGNENPVKANGNPIGNPNGIDSGTMGGRITKQEFLTVPGYSHLTAKELMSEYGIPRTTAYNWVSERDGKK